ncbi:molybdopterin molybdotransferase MoeA [Candidatus Formimonas warabiya]|uniref:Molybdopterin molybdenumtransferase n=1 Tax=Formimonas warabiya TaxID=1761012 RepID=A0A3G1KQN9_FORW1|nr:molybdopterin molybdotransferase MoeA [Candidatus Formimonas warabiya]ATW24789.1 hypothetical protein DCMF_08395 [Candidatus Formimonas warabiya]
MMKKITCERAQEILVRAVKQVSCEEVPILDALGRITAEDLYALHDLPIARQAAFDGFALCGLDHKGGFQVVEPYSCDPDKPFILQAGEAVHVGTGGLLPQGTEAVVQWEHGTLLENKSFIPTEVIPGSNIKKGGEDFKSGDLLVPRGTCLAAGLVGLLAAFGISKVSVLRRPKVLIISIGSGIIPYDGVPKPGETRDSNGPLLTSLVLRERGQVTALEVLGAKKIDEMRPTLEEIFHQSDLVFTTGGTFAGNRSEGQGFLEKIGAQELFSGVQLKPGGHVGAALWEGKPMVMLSGNPAACLVCFELFACPVLRMMQGLSPVLPRIQGRSLSSFSKKSMARSFLRAHVEWDQAGWTVEILPGQKPSMMRSFLGCNALIDLSPDHPPIQVGDMVPVILLDSVFPGSHHRERA